MARRMRRFFIPVSVTALSVIGTLGAFELGIRLFSPQTHFSVAVNVWDRRLGPKQVPECKGRLKTQEFDISIVINSKGLRDRECAYSKPDSTRGVLCLGDSFTFDSPSGTVSNVRRHTQRYLRICLDYGRANGMRWQVVNAGVNGTGTAHQLAYLETEGLKYNPDIVTVCICGVNDFSDNSMYGLYTLEDGGLVRHEARLSGPIRLRQIMQYLPGYRTIFGRSHLITFIKHRIARHAYARHASKSKDQAAYSTQSRIPALPM
ncbi:MAG: SGNH/GDSL hydrolase family protein [Candidatus Eisenbacteria bacterium]